MYDGADNLVSHASAPAGGTCNAASPRPCWRATSKGFRYVDKDLTPSGVQTVVLKAGVAGKASIVVKGRGAPLDTPALPITALPALVQMVNSDGVCWQAQYSAPSRNDASSFKARSD